MQRLLLIVVAAIVLCSSATLGTPILFFHISDIHLDLSYSANYNSSSLCRAPTNVTRFDRTSLLYPLDDRKQSGLDEIYPSSGMYGRYGCDSPLPLVESILQSMKTLNESPSFILLTGDLPGHDMDATTWTKSLAMVPKLLVQFFPQTKVYPAIGNNDVQPPYQVTCNNSQFETLFGLWSQWLPASQKEVFLNSGSYSVNVGSNLRIVSLNTLFYSPRLNLSSPLMDPCGQFQWLINELKSAASINQTVYIIGHIPPGLDSFALVPLWLPQYTETFQSIVSQFSDVISGLFFGHIHRDEFRVINSNTNDRYGSYFPYSSSSSNDNSDFHPFSVLIQSSFTPIYQNNPSYKLITTNPSLVPLDSQVYYLDLILANLRGVATFELEYMFRSSYGQPDMSAGSISNVINAMATDLPLFDQFYAFHTSMYLTNQALLLCAMRTSNMDDFAACVKTQQLARRMQLK